MIKVHGVETVITAWRRKGKLVEEAVSKVIAESAINIQRRAKETAPIRTGNLRNSIQVELFPDKGYVKAYAPYAHFVEYGTSRMRARPYMRPAAEEERRRIRGLRWQI